MCTSLELPTSPASLGPALQPRHGGPQKGNAEGDGIAQLHCPVPSETTFPQASGLEVRTQLPRGGRPGRLRFNCSGVTHADPAAPRRSPPPHLPHRPPWVPARRARPAGRLPGLQRSARHPASARTHAPRSRPGPGTAASLAQGRAPSPGGPPAGRRPPRGLRRRPAATRRRLSRRHAAPTQGREHPALGRPRLPRGLLTPRPLHARRRPGAAGFATGLPIRGAFLRAANRPITARQCLRLFGSSALRPFGPSALRRSRGLRRPSAAFRRALYGSARPRLISPFSSDTSGSGVAPEARASRKPG
ncbi:hypothetical protein VULLAG_LOCUS436 [Vulpes lagopus]